MLGGELLPEVLDAEVRVALAFECTHLFERGERDALAAQRAPALIDHGLIPAPFELPLEAAHLAVTDPADLRGLDPGDLLGNRPHQYFVFGHRLYLSGHRSLARRHASGRSRQRRTFLSANAPGHFHCSLHARSFRLTRRALPVSAHRRRVCNACSRDRQIGGSAGPAPSFRSSSSSSTQPVSRAFRSVRHCSRRAAQAAWCSRLASTSQRSIP